MLGFSGLSGVALSTSFRLFMTSRGFWVSFFFTDAGQSADVPADISADISADIPADIPADKSAGKSADMLS